MSVAFSATSFNQAADSCQNYGSSKAQAGAKGQKRADGNQGADGQQGADGLTAEEQQVVAKLAQTDRKVRAHEQAHLAAAGAYATGGANYQYQLGPDGRRYAVSGEVSIDTSEVSGDPQASIRKARAIQAAAHAPADPSAQDRQVAAAAVQMEAKARQELQRAQQAQLNGDLPEIGSIISILG